MREPLALKFLHGNVYKTGLYTLSQVMIASSSVEEDTFHHAQRFTALYFVFAAHLD